MAILQVNMRTDVAADWTSDDPTLLLAEIGYESDTGFWKWGDGVTAWTSLSYAQNFGGIIDVTGVATFRSNVTLNNTQPRFRLEENDAAVDNGNWELVANSEQLAWRAEPDDYSGSAGTFLLVTRTGVVIDTVELIGTDITFTGNTNTTGDARITSVNPIVRLVETGVTADNTVWDIDVESEQLRMRLGDDAETGFANWLVVDRTANVCDAVALTTTLFTVTGAQTITGALTAQAGQIWNTTRVTGTYTILVTDRVVFANTDGGAYTATLPVGAQGQSLRVINSGASGNALTLAPDGAEHLIGVNSNFTLFDGEDLDLTYDATDGWY